MTQTEAQATESKDHTARTIDASLKLLSNVLDNVDTLVTMVVRDALSNARESKDLRGAVRSRVAGARKDLRATLVGSGSPAGLAK